MCWGSTGKITGFVLDSVFDSVSIALALILIAVGFRGVVRLDVMYAPTVCHLDKLGRLKVIRQGSLLRLVNLDRWSNDCFGCHGGPLELQVESVYSKQAASFID